MSMAPETFAGQYCCIQYKW